MKKEIKLMETIPGCNSREIAVGYEAVRQFYSACREHPAGRISKNCLSVDYREDGFRYNYELLLTNS